MLSLVAAATMDFASISLKGPSTLKFIPEMLSCVLAMMVLLRAIRGGIATIAAKYWIVFAFLAFIIICGIFSNGVGSGPILAGMRYYLRAIPLFFVPAVARFSEKSTKRQLLLMLGIALLQVPVAIYQRWIILDAGRFSGDDVRGTVMDSGILSIFLICTVCVLTGFMMRKRLGKLPYFILFFVLLFPTTINETKATAVLLPLGLMATIITAAPRGKRLPIFLGGTAMLGLFAALMIPIYALMNANSPYKNDKSIVDFFTDEQQFNQYLQGKKDASLGTTTTVSRGQALKVSIGYLARDPVHLAMGLGMGNASHSNIGEQFTGLYYDVLGHFSIMSFLTFMLEIGVLGTSAVFLLYWMIFSDALAVAKADTGLVGAIAAGWIGIVAVIAVSNFYSVLHTFTSVSFFFWYFSGVIAARRGELSLAQRQVAPTMSAPARVVPKSQRVHG
ncbi:MAG TPA: hypothetical protein VJQ47_19490 [Steroidobacteraceae bacterium]|nr:hypothetical protein [Steroidobacteraceae bacterium]